MKLGMNASVIMGQLKMVVSSIVIFGVLPQYFLVWVGWRMISTFFPSWIYQAGFDCYYSIYQKLVLFFLEDLSGTQVILHGNVNEVLSKKERVIYLSNHQSTVDWVVVHMLAARQGSVGNVRYVMKDSLQLLPLYGFAFYQHGCVFVKRKLFDAKKMIASLKYLQNKRIFSWMVIFPEGTRYNPEMPEIIESSKKYAAEQGLAPLNQVLFPKYRGFHLLANSLKNNLDAVYDITVIYSCTKGNKKGVRTKGPSIFEFAAGCCDTIHIHINRVSISNIPTEESDLKKWMYKIFREKESLLENYYNNMLPPSNGHPLSKGIMSPSNFGSNFGTLIFFVTLSVPFVFTPFGRSLYVKIGVFGPLLSYMWLGLRSFF